MKPIDFLLFSCILGIVKGTQSAPNSTWWPCESLSPYQNLQLEQVLGQWYLVETISSLPGRVDTCAGIELIRPDADSWSNLIMVGQESSNGRPIVYENHTIVIPDSVNSPSLWDQPDIDAAVMVVDVGPANDTLALTTCQRFLGYDWTGVFSRDMNLDQIVLSLVNERLSNAGLRNSDSAVVSNTTGCPVPVQTT
ncbi:hypothetical protein B7P43_G11267 [Cryptotermes secundus]|uniref:Lipocalin/cytosolic fatty-acid binding domain-containing protein n=2 Tax=Cryptotermes secundus TaxID=105785 RepID=A0A2J7PZ59_9NEOP|nr:hypothetical protein B7P43_G11267 [Cryptotermes secundus]